MFITDHVKDEEISIQHCPTWEMLANCFTKPLQGSVFLKLWTAIMGHGPPSPQKEDHMSVLHNNDTNLEALDSNLEPSLYSLAPETSHINSALVFCVYCCSPKRLCSDLFVFISYDCTLPDHDHQATFVYVFWFCCWSVCNGHDLVRPNWHSQWHLMPMQVQEPEVPSWVLSWNLELPSCYHYCTPIGVLFFTTILFMRLYLLLLF